jgi:hypothetical protein
MKNLNTLTNQYETAHAGKPLDRLRIQIASRMLGRWDEQTRFPFSSLHL